MDEFVHQCAIKLPAGSKILGVGAGGQARILVDKHTRNRGSFIEIDIDPARKPDLVADICDLPFPDSSFDAVFMLEVLEHVPDQVAAAREVQRVLKKDGFLFLSVPFLFPVHDRPGDFHRLTSYALKRLFSGLMEIDVTEKFSTALTLTGLDCRRASHLDGWKAPLGTLFIVLNILFRLPFLLVLDKISPTADYPLGYFVVGRKGETQAERHDLWLPDTLNTSVDG